MCDADFRFKTIDINYPLNSQNKRLLCIDPDVWQPSHADVVINIFMSTVSAATV